MTIIADLAGEKVGESTKVNNKDALLTAAAEAVERGWSVIPASQDKRPAIGWTKYQNQSMSLEELKQQVSRSSVSILGVVTGHLSGIFVLDADDDKAKNFCKSLGLEPHASTQGGGFHYYFRFPADGRVIKTMHAASAKGYKEKFGLLDVRGEGGYANFAGNGEKGQYQIVRDPKDLYEIDSIPEELLKFIEERKRQTVERTEASKALASPAVTMSRLISKASEKVADGRDQACFWLAGQIRDNGHTKDEAQAAMQEFYGLLPDTNTKGEREEFSLNAALEKVDRAFDRDAREPWTVGPRFAATDIGNGERLAEAAKDELRFTEVAGWLQWDGKRWKNVGEIQIARTAKRVAKAMTQEAFDYSASGKGIENADAAAAHEKKAKFLMAHAMKSQERSKINAMINLAQSEESLFAKQEDFDQSPTLINLLNGTLDLETGRLSPHSREDKITRLVNINYDAEAQCPNWLTFLDTITDGDKELQNYLQRVSGYVLTGSSREQAIFLLHGEGQNGKSTFMNVLENLTREYAASVDSKSLLTKRNSSSGANNDVARLQGVRLAYASEPDVSGLLDEALLKSLSGGEKISARFLHKEFFEFMPEFKLFLSANHMPNVRGSDTGIWRRLKLVPFTHTIPESKREQDFFKKRLLPEIEGIMAWAVQGALDWNQDGLTEPDVIKTATRDYREEMDNLGQFISEFYDITPGKKGLDTANFYSGYRTWFIDRGMIPLADNRLGREMSSRKLGSIKSGGKRYYPLARKGKAVEPEIEYTWEWVEDDEPEQAENKEPQGEGKGAAQSG